MLADARLSASAVGRFQKDVHRAVEFQLRGVDVTLFELLLAGFEMLFGGGDEGRDRVGRSLRVHTDAECSHERQNGDEQSSSH